MRLHASNYIALVSRPGPSTRCFAHAAVAPASDHHPASRPSRKGKERQDTYRFPDRGRRGGSPDPFDILGLEQHASDREIKRQYYRLALLLHPDSSHPSASPEHFATLNQAYTLLSNPSSRSLYVKSGYGWSSSESLVDAQMRAEARLRRQGGAAAWRGRDFGRSGSWDNDWGPETSKGEERLMPNGTFFALVAGISLVLAWAQYQRANSSVGTHRDLLHQQHMDASHALAEARHEAALFGKERRERIRRRVREAEVLREVEEAEKEYST